MKIYKGCDTVDKKEELLSNINKVHTTKMGLERIRRNLKLNTSDVISYCKEKMLDKNCNVYRKGKNWYFENFDVRITVNAFSYTSITAHLLKK